MHVLLKCEEDIWKQRSKIFWLQLGDLNTYDFHKVANRRKRKNGITRLQDDDNNWHKKGKGLNTLIVNYFSDLFIRQLIEINFVANCVATRITKVQNDMLITPFLPKEVKLAVFSMHKDKSPGEDGFNPCFYQ